MPCRQSYECKGDCWLNTAGDYMVWMTISKYCKGTQNEKELIDLIFNGIEKRDKILEQYNFTKREKELVLGSWL